MAQFKLVMMFLGGILAFVGFQERVLGQGATEEPLIVELADLESGRIPANPHIQIDTHWRTNSEIVFRYEQERGAHGNELEPTARVDYAYYPVFSSGHAGVRNLANLTRLYGGSGAIPEHLLPEVGEFSVLVKTRRYKTVGSIPGPGWEQAEPVRGLVVNRTESLRDDEAALLQQGFPAADLNRVLILEQGRTPSSPVRAISLMGGGAGLSVLAAASLFVRRRT